MGFVDEWRRKKGNTKVWILYNINLRITARVVLITALYFRYKGLLSQPGQESRNDFEAKRSFLEFSKHVRLKMYYHCEKKSAIGHFWALKGLSQRGLLRQKTSEIKKQSVGKDRLRFRWILKPFPGSRKFREI